MLEVGAWGELMIRRHHFYIPHTAKTILYASDLHLAGRTAHIVQQVVRMVQSEQPEVVLLGGDMVDSQRGFAELTALIQQIGEICPVWAISGNHDVYVGVDKVQNCVENAGGLWLDGTSFYLTPNILVDGESHPVTDKSIFSILCAHQPDVFSEAVQKGYKLVLAGHLHGSQFVLGHYRGKLYPGAWFFRWNGDVFHQGDCTMIVSRGVNDTLPIRWNCPREVIICSIGET